MKKIIFTLAIAFGLAFGAMAQNDSFFNDWNDLENRDNTNPINPTLPALPQGGMTGNQSPVGSGLIILTALGAGYAFLKRREER